MAARVDESWSMDFMSDELFDDCRIRLLTMVDYLYFAFGHGSPTLGSGARQTAG